MDPRAAHTLLAARRRQPLDDVAGAAAGIGSVWLSRAPTWPEMTTTHAAVFVVAGILLALAFAIVYGTAFAFGRIRPRPGLSPPLRSVGGDTPLGAVLEQAPRSGGTAQSARGPTSV